MTVGEFRKWVSVRRDSKSQECAKMAEEVFALHFEKMQSTFRQIGFLRDIYDRGGWRYDPTAIPDDLEDMHFDEWQWDGEKWIAIYWSFGG